MQLLLVRAVHCALPILFLLPCLPGVLLGQTVVSGVVLDERNSEPLAYATVQFSSGRSGVRTDIRGRFLIETADTASAIRVTYVGYAPQVLPIQAGRRNELRVLLHIMDAQLREVTIRPEKYKKKNPAVDLIEQVFLHKDQNRKEGLAYYKFEKHERLRFDLNGVTDQFRRKWYMRKFRFVFDYCDTNQVNQKVALPFYFRERLLESFYRREPRAKKDKLMAERQTAFEDDYDVDKDGISSYLNNMYTEIDIYEPTITLLDKQFMGPLSASATAFYRFYITDTVMLDNQQYADVFFAPKNKSDLAFMGNMLVALDSTYAVRRVEMGISNDINLNWVADIRIEQDFEFQGSGDSRRLLLSKDRMLMDMKIWKNKEGRSLLAIKDNAYRNYRLNEALPDSLFKGKILLLRDTGQLEARPTDFWDRQRPQLLSAAEVGVGTMITQVKNTRTFRITKGLGLLLGTGYQRIGKFELGELANLWSFNDVEGNRFQLSARTNDRHFKKIRVQGFAAYGMKDQAWKFGGNTTFAFKGARPGRFPAHQLRASYVQDLFFPGLGTSAGQSLIGSIQSGRTNRLLLNKRTKVEYAREFRSGWGYSGYVQHNIVNEAGLVGETSTEDATTTETGAWLRFAPNERFIQGRTERIAIRNKWPVFYLQYKAGLKGVLGGDYAYQRASLRTDKVFYVAPFGKSRWSAEVGKIFGQVSYPFLEIHRANRTYFFDEYGFNLMNYLEFVSDRYAMLHINHDFEGILFNRIPGIKKMRLREGITFKALYGGLSGNNIPSSGNGLIPFPTDENSKPLTQGLGSTPYMEASAGIGNLFGFLRVEYVRRLSYLQNPDIAPWGVRLMFSAGF